METKPNLKQTLIDHIGILDQIIDTFSVYKVAGQQPIFLREIIIRLTDAKLWVVNGATLLDQAEKSSQTPKGKEN